MNTDTTGKTEPGGSLRSASMLRTAAFLAALTVIVVGAVLAWRLLAPSKAGRSVPAPASVTFGADDDALESGAESVTLQPAQIENAGIVSEEVVEVPLDSTGSVNGTGVLQADAYGDVPVTAPAGGAVLEVRAKLGDRLRTGDVLAVVQSDEFAAAEGAFISAKEAEQNARRNLERAKRLAGINNPGRGGYDEASKALIDAEAGFSESKSRFERARKLLEIGSISKEQFEAEATRFRSAEAEVTRSKAALARAESLLDVSPEVKAQEEEARERLIKSSSDLASARARLGIFGFSDSDLARLIASGAASGRYSLRARSAGTVTFRNCNAGQIVRTDENLFRVTDLKRLWFVAQVFEEDARNLRAGSVAEVLHGAGNAPVRGRISFIDPKLDETTRTVQVRIELDNPDGRLRIGSLATAAFSPARGERGVAVKKSAVQRIGRQDIVFVVGKDGLTFQIRPVRLGEGGGELMRVLEGLKAGERIVVDGGFWLRAEYLKTKPS